MKRWVFVTISLFTMFYLSSNLFGQSIYDLRKLTEQDWLAMSTEERLNAIVANPKLINRPIVVAPAGVKICRPPELVSELIKTSR